MTRGDDDAILAEVRKFARRVDRCDRAADRARSDLRDVIRGALAAGLSTRPVAEAAGVSQPRIVQLMKEI